LPVAGLSRCCSDFDRDPVIRVRGYLAITTLGFGEIVRIAFNKSGPFHRGPTAVGIARPKLFGYSFSVNATPYFI